MDWKYEEYLRDREFYENEVRGIYRPINDLFQSVESIPVISLEKYPVRLDHRILLSSVVGFKQHPNSLQAM
jgi:replicative DNA helicase